MKVDYHSAHVQLYARIYPHMENKLAQLAQWDGSRSQKLRDMLSRFLLIPMPEQLQLLADYQVWRQKQIYNGRTIHFWSDSSLDEQMAKAPGSTVNRGIFAGCAVWWGFGEVAAEPQRKA